MPDALDAAVERGLADIEAGRAHAFEEVAAELAQRYTPMGTGKTVLAAQTMMPPKAAIPSNALSTQLTTRDWVRSPPAT